MNADRFEIIDDGHLTIAIRHGANTLYIDELEDEFAVAAIRQQARDIKLLTQMLHDQRLVIDDLEHRRVKVCDENDQLRTNLAAAIAERDATRRHAQDLTECAMKTIPADWRPCYAWTDDSVMNVLAEYVIELRNRAEKAEARLAAIEAAPTVATVVAHTDEGGMWPALDYEDEDLPPIGTELIARPAKD